jgi:hypothetical protein
MFAGVPMGAGTDAVAGHMAGGGCSTASTRRSRLRVACSLVFAFGASRAENVKSRG